MYLAALLSMQSMAFRRLAPNVSAEALNNRMQQQLRSVAPLTLDSWGSVRRSIFPAQHYPDIMHQALARRRLAPVALCELTVGYMSCANRKRVVRVGREIQDNLESASQSAITSLGKRTRCHRGYLACFSR